MKILFISDPLEGFKPYKDSTYAMMRAAQTRGHAVWSCLAQDLFSNEQGIAAHCAAIHLNLPYSSADYDARAPWYSLNTQETTATVTSKATLLASFDAVIMRTDPPFDSEYFYATHLLSVAEAQGARVFNSGAAIRNHPEKLSILEFPHLTPRTLVSANAKHIRAFVTELSDVILKPLDGMGGAGIFRVKPQDPNLGVILETMLTDARGKHQIIMAQAYNPAITAGDKRILIINGEPVPYCLARIPMQGETRGNLAAGGRGVAQPLSASDWRIARELGPILAARGLFLVGLDVIGETLTEINVTSPTCFQEIFDQTGFDVAGAFVLAVENAIEATIRKKRSE